MVAGDVWVASGQSNMEWPVSSAHNAPRPLRPRMIALIRHFGVPHAFSEQPAEDVAGGSWAAADPAARWKLHGGRLFLRARGAEVGQRTDRAPAHLVGRKQHRDVDEPRGAWHVARRAGGDCLPPSVRAPSRYRQLVARPPGFAAHGRQRAGERHCGVGQLPRSMSHRGQTFRFRRSGNDTATTDSMALRGTAPWSR